MINAWNRLAIGFRLLRIRRTASAQPEATLKKGVTNVQFGVRIRRPEVVRECLEQHGWGQARHSPPCSGRRWS